MYDFLLMFNRNIGPNLAPVLNTSLHNMSDLVFDLSMSLEIKSNGSDCPRYDFLLMSNIKYMSICHHLSVISTRILFSYLLSLCQILDKHTQPYPVFYLKLNGLIPWSQGSLPPSMKLIS